MLSSNVDQPVGSSIGKRRPTYLIKPYIYIYSPCIP